MKKITLIMLVITGVCAILAKLLLLDKNLFSIKADDIWNNIFFWGMAVIFYFTIIKRIYSDRKVNNEIDEMITDLKDISIENIEDMYDDINLKFTDKNKYSELNEIWKNYRDTIISVEDEKLGKTKICQTIDADNFFNNDTLLKEKMNYKLLNYIPQLLVGLGLLGTFLGLSIGLSGLNLSSNDKEQLNALIEGVKTSFYTSLYGMYFSIIFSIIINCYIGEFEEKILKLKDKLNNIFHKNIGNEVIEEIKIELRKLRNSNDDMAKNIANELGNGIEKIRETNEVSMKEIVGAINSQMGGISQDLSGSFEKSIGESLEKIFSSDFVEKFESIKNELIDVSQKNNIFITEYKNEIRDIAYKTGEIKESYSETADKIVENFDAIFSKIEDKYIEIEEMYSNSTNLYKELNEIYSKNKEMMQQSNDFIEKYEKVSGSLESFIEAEKSIVDMWNGYKDSFDKLNLTIGDNMKNYEETVRITVNEYKKILESNSQLYGNIINKGTLEYTENINKGTETLFKEYDSNLTGVIDKFSGVLKVFREDINKMSEVMEKNLEKITVFIEKDSNENRR